MRAGRVLLVAGALVSAVQAFTSNSTAAPAASGAGRPNAKPAAQRDDAGSFAAFLTAYPVFMHPRCRNCHPAGDVPLQGEDSHLHAQNVTRGPDGKGLYALKCANCHGLANPPGEHMPPGNPNWHLTPVTMRMTFEGRTPAELARQLQDPKQNGGKSLEQLIHHVEEDPLVLGGWSPGLGRSTPPISHKEFTTKLREWVDKGAASRD